MALDNAILEATANGPAAPNPLATAGAIQQLKMQPLQMQQAQQAVQEGQYKLNEAGRTDQAAQQQQAAQQAARAALTKHTSIDPTTGSAKIDRGGVLADMSTAGFAPEAIALSQQWSAGDEAQHAKTLADAKETLANQKSSLELHAQVLGPYLNSISQQNPTGDPALWAQAKQSFVQNGWAQPNQIPDIPNPTIAQQIYGSGLTAQQQTEAAQKKIEEAETAQKDKATTDQAAAVLKNTQQNQETQRKQEQQRIGIEGGRLQLEREKFKAAEADPEAAGALLVSGDATLSELKARGSTPQFITKTLEAAHRQSGGRYNAQQADAQYSVAKSPTNVAFFGSAKSLTDPGGTLDQLQHVGDSLPANQIPVFNTIEDWTKAATGSGPIAQYAATALGVADDYAKVMGGGQGSDTSRKQALDIIKASASPEARQAALQGIRGAVSSQTKSRIGSNPVLRRMYGDSAAFGSTQGGYKITAGNGRYATNDEPSSPNARWYDPKTGKLEFTGAVPAK